MLHKTSYSKKGYTQNNNSQSVYTEKRTTPQQDSVSEKQRITSSPFNLSLNLQRRKSSFLTHFSRAKGTRCGLMDMCKERRLRGRSKDFSATFDKASFTAAQNPVSSTAPNDTGKKRCEATGKIHTTVVITGRGLWGFFQEHTLQTTSRFSPLFWRQYLPSNGNG